MQQRRPVEILLYWAGDYLHYVVECAFTNATNDVARSLSCITYLQALAMAVVGEWRDGNSLTFASLRISKLAKRLLLIAQLL